MRFDELLPILRRHLWWLAPLLLLIVNLAVLASYRSLYSGRAQALDDAIAREQSQLDELQEQQRLAEQLADRATQSGAGIETLYGDRFASESERFTDVAREVRQLARRAGLDYDRVGYPEQRYDDYDLIKRSMVFEVAGSYRELRLFVNYLELSDYFLVLESLDLQESEGGLQIRVSLSTLFSGRDGSRVSLALGPAEAEDSDDGEGANS